MDLEQVELVEDFYGVYLLYNINPKYKGRTYIGYTRDPNRRIMQHNRGTWAGGAYRTNNKGPWLVGRLRFYRKMVMIVHGFPNNISALRFEWAWQNPNKTTRLQHLNLMKIPRKESESQFKLRVLSVMLSVGPWYRLPLIIRWLEKNYFEEFPVERKPPDHMAVCHGLVKSKNLKKNTEEKTLLSDIQCLLCFELITEVKYKLSCLNGNCKLIAHITCLGDLFLQPGEFVPIEGVCPFCDTKLKWGDLIRKMKGCSQTENLVVADNVNEQDDNIDEQDESDDELICTQDKQFVDNNSHWLIDCETDL